MSGLQNYLFSVTLLVMFTPTFSSGIGLTHYWRSSTVLNQELTSETSLKVDGGKSVISCYQCHSEYNDDCKNLMVNSSIYYRPCNDSDKYAGKTPFCRKITQKIVGKTEIGNLAKEIVVRKCGWVENDKECYKVRTWDHSETVCQCFSDGCNLSATIRGSLVILLLPLFAPAMLT